MTGVEKCFPRRDRDRKQKKEKRSPGDVMDYSINYHGKDPETPGLTAEASSRRHLSQKDTAAAALA